MKLVIDGITVQEQAGSITEALETARDRAERAGRLIIEVLADGRPALELVDAETAQPVAELGVTTADRGLFLRETLRDAREAMEATRSDQQVAAALFDRGELSQGSAALGRVMEGWQGVRAVIEHAALLMEARLSALPVGDGSAEDAVRGLGTELVALRDAVHAEDWSALSDLLLGELDARAVLWVGMLDALIDASGGPAA